MNFVVQVEQVEIISATNLYDDGRLTEEHMLAYAKLLGQLSSRAVSVEAAKKQIHHVVSDGRISETVVWLFVEDALIGTAQATLIRTAWPYIYVNYVVVDKNKRQHGLGSRLMRELITRARSKWPEADRVELTSDPQSGTKSFYEALGFTPSETTVYRRQF